MEVMYNVMHCEAKVVKSEIHCLAGAVLPSLRPSRKIVRPRTTAKIPRESDPTPSSCPCVTASAKAIRYTTIGAVDLRLLTKFSQA